MSDRVNKVVDVFQSPKTVEPLNSGDAPRTPDKTRSDEPPIEAQGAQYPQNDLGNGQRFALYCGNDAMHVPRVGWYCWDGKRWRIDPDKIGVRALAQTISGRIETEVSHVTMSETEKEHYENMCFLQEQLKTKTSSSNASATDEIADLRTKIAALKEKVWGRSTTKSRHLAHARSTGNSGKMDNLLLEATTSLSRDVDELDSDPLTVNAQNGLLQFAVEDLRDEGAGRYASVELIEHQRVSNVAGKNAPQYVTKMCPVDYDPDATCPLFDQFLEQVQPDIEMRRFLQRWFGLSLTALPVQKFLYCYGMGANGKSVLTNLMRRMMGDYATMVRIESLTGKNRSGGSDATPDLMRLIGARAAITNEPEEGERLQEQKIKEMTGGDEMLVRNLHSDFVAFTPYFKLTFTGNHKLEIRGTDDGIWRRPLLCPFNIQIPESQRDELFGNRLFEQERPGIFNWMVQGLLEYLEIGLNEPEAVRSATEEYRSDSDPIGSFLTTGCVVDGESTFIPARTLMQACYLWLLKNTSHAWQPGHLSRRLKDRAEKFIHPQTKRTYRRHKTNGNWGYTGVQLTPEMAAELKDAPRDLKGMPTLTEEQGA